MAKDTKKKPQVEAPIVDNANETKKTDVSTLVNAEKRSGLTQGEKTVYLAALQRRKEELKGEKSAASASIIAGLDLIQDSTILDIALGEIACGTSAIGIVIRGNEENYETFQMLAKALHVTLPSFKSLPAPTKEQLKQAGITSIEPGSSKFLLLESKQVDAEAKKEKKKEKALQEQAKDKDYLTDHTKISSEDQLKEALGFQLVNPAIANPVDRVITAAQFYRSYLESRAENASDPKAELDKIHGYTLSDLLQDVSTMVPPTFVSSGFGKILSSSATNAKSIIPAFGLFKRACTNRKTNVCKFEDDEIAALVRVLIVWRCTSEIADISKSIAEINKNIAALNKNAKANTKAIETEKNKIEAKTAAISKIQETISLAVDPGFELADSFLTAYNNEDNPMHEQALLVYKSIVETYYKDVNIPELEFDSFLLSIQQRAGIILNLFNSAIGQRDDYSIENLIACGNEPGQEKKEEKTEEEVKNA